MESVQQKKASTGTNIRAHYFQSYWYDYYDLRSSRPKNISPEVMSPEILSQVPRNAELCGSKFYHAQKHPSILITHLSPLFHCSTRVKERNILQIYTPTFVSSLFKERGMLHLHSARFVSWYIMVKNETLQNLFILQKLITFVSLYTSPEKIRATRLSISGELTFGRQNRLPLLVYSLCTDVVFLNGFNKINSHPFKILI